MESAGILTEQPANQTPLLSLRTQPKPARPCCSNKLPSQLTLMAFDGGGIQEVEIALEMSKRDGETALDNSEAKCR
ncbi:hypothetical protein PIB30_017095, partial [Stylosanthes scabra]|nr:hypothetical protein [Stylosanthes scabra]